MTTICDKCQQPVAVGQWPFCPHAPVRKLEYHEDAIPGGMLVENGVPEPTVVYSHSELRRLRDQHGWQVKETWNPMPGSDRDPQGIPNPMGYTDPYTFENGRTLILRQAKADPALYRETDDRVISHAELTALLKDVS